MTDESGYASIAETASINSVSSSNSSSLHTESVRMRKNKRKQLVRESIATADMEEIEEKISEIFESMNLGETFAHFPKPIDYFLQKQTRKARKVKNSQKI